MNSFISAYANLHSKYSWNAAVWEKKSRLKMLMWFACLFDGIHIQRMKRTTSSNAVNLYRMCCSCARSKVGSNETTLNLTRDIRFRTLIAWIANKAEINRWVKCNFLHCQKQENCIQWILYQSFRVFLSMKIRVITNIDGDNSAWSELNRFRHGLWTNFQKSFILKNGTFTIDSREICIFRKQHLLDA